LTDLEHATLLVGTFALTATALAAIVTGAVMLFRRCRRLEARCRKLAKTAATQSKRIDTLDEAVAGILETLQVGVARKG
jgi:hypothetical protein